jgi:hypothetical protein
VLYSRVVAQLGREVAVDAHRLIQVVLQQLSSCPPSESTRAAKLAASQLLTALFGTSFNIQELETDEEQDEEL